MGWAFDKISFVFEERFSHLSVSFLIFTLFFLWISVIDMWLGSKENKKSTEKEGNRIKYAAIPVVTVSSEAVTKTQTYSAN